MHMHAGGIVGNLQFKKKVMICNSNISLPFSPSRFILIACDGLWKVFHVEDAARFIINVLEVVTYL